MFAACGRQTYSAPVDCYLISIPTTDDGEFLRLFDAFAQERSLSFSEISAINRSYKDDSILIELNVGYENDRARIVTFGADSRARLRVAENLQDFLNEKISSSYETVACRSM